jgi:hypothetical protein
MAIPSSDYKCVRMRHVVYFVLTVPLLMSDLCRESKWAPKLSWTSHTVTVAVTENASSHCELISSWASKCGKLSH